MLVSYKTVESYCEMVLASKWIYGASSPLKTKIRILELAQSLWTQTTNNDWVENWGHRSANL